MVRPISPHYFGYGRLLGDSHRVCHCGSAHPYWMERKVCAYFQCRLGPMRVGPWGLLQVFADVVKMLIKEIFFVDKADKFLYIVAPFLVIIGSVGAFGFLPWNKGAVVVDFNVGIFLLTAVSVTIATKRTAEPST